MILQRLCELYDVLDDDESVKIASVGYSNEKCSYCIVLTRDGNMSRVMPLGHETKKDELHFVPEHTKRSSSTAAYFLCDSPKYLLGYEYKTDDLTKKKELKATLTQIQSSLALHKKIIGNSPNEGLHAVLLFLEKQSEFVSQNPIIMDETYKKKLDEVCKGKSILFQLENETTYIHEHQDAKRLWEEYAQKQADSDENDVRGQCLITGDLDVPIKRIHNSVLIPGGRSTGCSLVSFKPVAFCSYGKEQCYNAPVSEIATFKYITALKFLLDNPKMHTLIGETTVVFWATKSSDAQDIMSRLFPVSQQEVKPDPITDRKIHDIFARIKEGKSFRDITREESVSTYILGLSPNAARASIRFWYETTFEQFMKNMGRHQDEMALSDNTEKRKLISLNQILRNSVSLNVTKDWWKKVPTSFENALFNAILLGGDYPISLYVNILQRMRTEAGATANNKDEYSKNMKKSKKNSKNNTGISKDSINYIRVGFIKAVLCRNFQREDINMSLNLKSTNKAYNLGRLFAVLEKLQVTANKKSTIRGRFFASASTNPKLVFPSLLNLAQHHIEKVDSEQNDLASKYYDADISKLLWSVENEFPAVLDLEEQGLFILGYYHQRKYYYLKKEEKEKLRMEA